MGRQPWTSRLTVEESPIHLSVAAWSDRTGHPLSPGSDGAISWTQDGRTVGRLGYEIRTDDRVRTVLLFPRQVFKFEDRLCMFPGQSILITFTRPYWGGQRHWFECGCGRRSGRLYMPHREMPGFRCRICWDLTFRSSQQHSKRIDALRMELRILGLESLLPGLR